MIAPPPSQRTQACSLTQESIEEEEEENEEGRDEKREEYALENLLYPCIHDQRGNLDLNNLYIYIYSSS